MDCYWCAIVTTALQNRLRATHVHDRRTHGCNVRKNRILLLRCLLYFAVALVNKSESRQKNSFMKSLKTYAGYVINREVDLAVIGLCVSKTWFGDKGKRNPASIEDRH